MKYAILLLSVVLLATGCIESGFSPDFEQESVLGYRPIYANRDTLHIDLLPPREIGTAGKIYSYGDFLLVNEVGQGVHLYDNSNPKAPTMLRFISIPGNVDVAMKSGILYADSYNDLLALEVLSDTVKLLKRLPDVMGFSGEFPAENNVYFECVEEGKGSVIGWERVELSKPKCYKP